MKDAAQGENIAASIVVGLFWARISYFWSSVAGSATASKHEWLFLLILSKSKVN